MEKVYLSQLEDVKILWPISQIKKQLQPHGFSLGAAVDFDPAPNTSTG